MNLKSGIITALVSLVVIFFIVAVGSQPSQKSLPWDVNNISSDDLVSGAPKETLVSVNIVEYFDLQCPACAFFYDQVEKAKQEFQEQIRVVYRHYPLTQIHQFAQEASEALEGLAQTGKDWQKFIENVYHNQQELSKSKIIQWAVESGAKEGDVRRWLDEGAYRQSVLDDVNSGNLAGVEGTPTFFVNGEQFSWQDYSQLQAKIKSLLDKKNDSSPKKATN